MTTLFVSGFNDNSTAKVYPGPDESVVLKYDGCCGVSGYMDFGKLKVDSLNLFGDKHKQRIRISPKISVIFNEISDADSHQGALKRCEALCRKAQLPVINHPSNIRKTTRDNIPVLLKDIPGLKVPATIALTPRSPGDIFTEIDRAGLVFPVIVRLAGQHGGISSILISGRDDVDKLHVYPFDGSKFYLTQFVDFVSDDGYYRKFRIVVIDGVPLYRHHLIDRQWMIHAASRRFMVENSSLMDESIVIRDKFDEHIAPMIRPAIDEITRRLQLEYYGIDCNIDKQGDILIFEVNANMAILINTHKVLEKQVRRIKQHILKLIKKTARRTTDESSTATG
jgi:glutathione synthase/RimK-type ligase-like ATP-grasp enzyme